MAFAGLTDVIDLDATAVSTAPEESLALTLRKLSGTNTPSSNVMKNIKKLCSARNAKSRVRGI